MSSAVILTHGIRHFYAWIAGMLLCIEQSASRHGPEVLNAIAELHHFAFEQDELTQPMVKNT